MIGNPCDGGPTATGTERQSKVLIVFVLSYMGPIKPIKFSFLLTKKRI
jgi:hypothetical protein